MRRRPWYQQSEWRIYAALTALAVGLTVWHDQARRGSRPSPPERLVRATLGPLQDALTSGWREAALTVTAVGRARDLARENLLLKQRLAEKEAKLTERQNQYMDYLRLREVLGFSLPLPADLFAARVVGRSGGRFLRQTIDIEAAGGRQIRQGDVVRTELGLVGRVASAHGSRATATIILDPNSGVAAAVSPSGLLGSILGPDLTSPDPDLLRLARLDRNAVVSMGEKVFTAPIGETYPPGIPIGVVEEVVGGAASGEGKTALVRPYVDFDHLSYVLIVRST